MGEGSVFFYSPVRPVKEGYWGECALHPFLLETRGGDLLGYRTFLLPPYKGRRWGLGEGGMIFACIINTVPETYSRACRLKPQRATPKSIAHHFQK